VISFSHGAGGISTAFASVGAAMTGISSLGNTTLGIINSNYFTTNNFSTAMVTKLGGAVGASYLLATVGYNGWAAWGSQVLTIISTGRKLATCYNYHYATTFLPLIR